MKWSELPQEYRDLENKFPELKRSDSELIQVRFRWNKTPQGYSFWNKCLMANHISELPKIES